MAITPNGFHALKDSERPPAVGASRVGPTDPGEMVSISLGSRRRTDAQAVDPNAYAATPRSEHHVFPREDYAQRCGVSQGDLDLISEFAKANGLKVVERSAARRLIRERPGREGPARELRAARLAHQRALLPSLARASARLA